MPTYEYQCQKCRKRHEVFQSITAKPLRTCPKCRGQLTRLLGVGSGFLFKGSGFYSTDYRSKSYRDAKRKDESRSSTSTPSSEKKSPAQPASPAPARSEPRGRPSSTPGS